MDMNAVAAFIMLSGIKILKNTTGSILGKGPSDELIRKLNHLKKYDGVIGFMIWLFMTMAPIIALLPFMLRWMLMPIYSRVMI